jgi:hypothetical protein
MDSDGEILDPSPAQLIELAKRLDYALVRLSEPIGVYSRRASGGVRRGWFDLSAIVGNVTLARHDRIIIPQHPYGQPQRIDFGRFDHADRSDTRIRYSTETGEGTSGAPCFNQNFRLVGVHNAAFRPSGVTIANQAVYFDVIAAKMFPHYANVNTAAPSLPWSVSDNLDRPEVIIGRQKFLDWTNRGLSDEPAKRAERIYAAVALRPRCGKSFSLRILKASLRDNSEILVEFGTSLEKLPDNVTDFVSAFFNQLRIPLSELATMPPRPSPETTGGPAEDKLNAWYSRVLPTWFDSILRRYGEWEADLRVEAAERVRLSQKQGHQPDPTDERWRTNHSL